MKKVVRLTETDLVRIVKNVVKENNTYSGDELKSAYSNLGDDEDISLSDVSGTLYGRKVSKKEYLENMLKDAVNTEDWGKVHRAILYLNTKM
jgi:hypothetical protein